MLFVIDFLVYLLIILNVLDFEEGSFVIEFVLFLMVVFFLFDDLLLFCERLLVVGLLFVG